MSPTVPPPPFNANVSTKDGRMTPEWQRHVLASQNTLVLDTAPADARYVVATANASLTAEVNLGALSAGYLKQTVAAGVASPTTTATIPASDLTGSLPALDGSALTNLNASALATGTVAGARLPDPLPAISGANLTTLNATNLSSGTVPDGRFPATLPASSGVNLTALNASALASGTLPDARFPATLPAASGVNLTALNASNLASGTVPNARLGSPLPALNGAALTALTGTNVVHAIKALVVGDSPYSVLATDETLLVDATGGAVTVTLPTATAGRMLAVKKTDASVNAVTLAGTVDGVVNPTLGSRYDTLVFQADGTTWWALGGV